MLKLPWLMAETWTEASIWAKDLSNKRGNSNNTNISVGQKATYATEKCFTSQSNGVFFLHKLGTGEHANMEGEGRRQ